MRLPSTLFASLLLASGSIAVSWAQTPAGTESSGAQGERILQDPAATTRPSTVTRASTRRSSTTEPAQGAAAGSGTVDAVDPMFQPPPYRASSTLVTVTLGDLPIIISAPHGGTSSIPNVPKRTNTSVPQFETVTDGNTRQVAERVIATIEQLSGSKPFGVVAKFDREFIDANRSAPYAYEVAAARDHYWAYHQALQRACDEVTRRWGKGILIDLHGQGRTADVIYRGTRTGLTVGHILDRHGNDGLLGRNSVIGQMQHRGYNFLPTPTATDIGTETMLNGGYIVFAYGAQNQAHIDAIQFEMGSSFRKDAKVNQTGDDIAASVVRFIATHGYLPNDHQLMDTK